MACAGAALLCHRGPWPRHEVWCPLLFLWRRERSLNRAQRISTSKAWAYAGCFLTELALSGEADSVWTWPGHHEASVDRKTRCVRFVANNLERYWLSRVLNPNSLNAIVAKSRVQSRSGACGICRGQSNNCTVFFLSWCLCFPLSVILSVFHVHIHIPL